MSTENIRPEYYSPEDPYEVIKVIDAWGLGFCLGSAIRYIKRAGKKDPSKHIEDLVKARTYIYLEIERVKLLAQGVNRSDVDLTLVVAAPDTVTVTGRNLTESSEPHEGRN